MITKEIFEFTVEETLALEWAVLWLCYNCPFPLSLPEKVYRKKDERILTKNNIERIIDYYSVTYEQVRKSPLGKQIFSDDRCAASSGIHTQRSATPDLTLR